MRIHIIAIGNRMPAWVNTAYSEYAKRMPRECRLHLHQVPAAGRPRNADVQRLLKEENARLLAAAPAGCRLIALDRSGKQMSTEEMSKILREWLAGGETPAFLIGGPEGLTPECLQRAHAVWSLSRLTLPHPLVRVVLAEQLYRAWSIIKGLPYHR